jgi:hypothetical protein
MLIVYCRPLAEANGNEMVLDSLPSVLTVSISIPFSLPSVLTDGLQKIKSQSALAEQGH